MEKSKAELKLSALNRGSKGTYHSSTPKNRDIKCFNKKTTTDTRNDGEIKIDDNMKPNWHFNLKIVKMKNMQSMENYWFPGELLVQRLKRMRTCNKVISFILDVMY